MQPYPNNTTGTIPSITAWIAFVSRVRQQDINDFNNLQQTFQAGRRVGKIPSSSTDIAAADRINDFNSTADYAYFCVSDGSGGAVWRRVALATW